MFKGLFINKDFFLLFQGQLFSLIGTYVYMIGMIFWLKHTTGSATIVGLISMTSLLPSVLLGPFGGAVADLYSRKHIIILTDVINGCLMLSIATVMLIFPTAKDFIIGLLFVIALNTGILGAFFRPAMYAAIPDLVPENKVTGANARLQGSVQLSIVVGQALGGILYKMLGAPVLMFINGCSYLLSALSESFITLPQQQRKKPANARETIKQLKTDVKEGFNYVRHTAGLSDLFLTFAILYFFMSPLSVLLPFFVEDSLHATPEWYGYLMAVWAVGLLTGSFITSMISTTSISKSKLLIAAILLFAISFGSIGYSKITYIVLSVLYLNGTFFGYITLLIRSTVQLTTPNELRGRILALLTTVSIALAPIAMGIAGIIADLIDQNIPLIFLVCGGSLFIVTIRLFFSPGFHAFFDHDVKNVKG